MADAQAKGRLGQPLDEFLGEHKLASVLAALAAAAQPIAERIALGALGGDLDVEAVGSDAQKALATFADEAFARALRGVGVQALASEARETPVMLDPEGQFLVAMDPLDSSSNIDANVTIGSIVSVLEAPARAGAEDVDFLQPGHRQRAAAIIVYGPQTAFVFTVGAGTHAATLDLRSGEFRMTRFNIQIPEGKTEYAINASNARHWPEPVKAYVEDCVMGESGPRAKDFNMRWIDSLVADAYRILMRGGVYLYPEDERTAYRKGRLRLLYEANPISFLVEQAGGLATDGVNRILDIAPAELRARTPLIFGSTDKVERIRGYFLEGHRSAARAPLFGKRGLLRG